MLNQSDFGYQSAALWLALAAAGTMGAGPAPGRQGRHPRGAARVP